MTGFPQPLNPADYAHLTTRTNSMRADEGRALCEKLEEMSGSDMLRDQVSDIMCQLMHLCRLIRDEDGAAIDFEDCLRGARMNFMAEVEEDPDY